MLGVLGWLGLEVGGGFSVFCWGSTMLWVTPCTPNIVEFPLTRTPRRVTPPPPPHSRKPQIGLGYSSVLGPGAGMSEGRRQSCTLGFEVKGLGFRAKV